MFLKLHFEIEGGLLYFEYNEGVLLQQLTSSKSLRIVHHESEIIAFIVPEDMMGHFEVNSDENNLLAGVESESE